MRCEARVAWLLVTMCVLVGPHAISDAAFVERVYSGQRVGGDRTGHWETLNQPPPEVYVKGRLCTKPYTRRHSISDNDEVTTKRLSVAIIVLQGASAVNLGPKSRFRVRGDQKFQILEGKVYGMVDRRIVIEDADDRPGFGHHIETRSTEFMIEVLGDTTRVSVFHGTVDFGLNGPKARAPVPVHQGYQRSARIREDPGPEVEISPGQQRLLMEWTLASNLSDLPREPRFPDAEEGLAGRLHAGDDWFKQRKFEEARDAYHLVAAQVPGHPSTLVRLGYTLLELDEPAEAQQQFLDADRAYVRQRGERRRVQPIAQLSPPVDEMEYDPDALEYGPAAVGLAWLELVRAKNNRALQLAHRAVAIDPSVAEARVALGVAFMRQQDAAEEHPRPGEETVRSIVHAQQELERAIAIEPAYHPAWAYLATVYLAENENDQALCAADQAVALKKESPLARWSQILARFYSGDRKAERKARSAALEAEKLGVTTAALSVAMAQAYLSSGDLERALRRGAEAVRQDARMPFARYVLGVVHAERWEYIHAERELVESLRIAPDFLRAARELARVRLAMGKVGTAARGIEAIAARHPEAHEVLAAMGEVYLEQAEYHCAVELYEAAIEQYRKDRGEKRTSLLYLLGAARAHLATNQLPQALQRALEAVDTNPRLAEARAVLGLVYDRMRNAEQAQRQYREALSLSPDNALARLGLGIRGPQSGERLLELERLFTSGSLAAGRLPERLTRVLASNPDAVDDLREVAQAMMRNPSVLQLPFFPGLTAEVAPSAGSNAARSLGLTHRERLEEGRLHTLSFARLERSHNYRDGRSERRAFAWANVAQALSYRSAILGQFFYSGRERPLPGAIQAPDPNDRARSWSLGWDLSERYLLTPNTVGWLHVGPRLSRAVDRNPDAPEDLVDPAQDIVAFRGSRFQQLSLEGRLDHGWGDEHLTSYVFSVGWERSLDRLRIYVPEARAFQERSFLGRSRLVVHSLQHDYRPGPRLSLLAGVTVEQLRDRSHTDEAGGPTVERFRKASTLGLPFGQATYTPTDQDLVRFIAHRRRQHPFEFLLAPAEAFLVGEPPSLALSGTATNFELDYEHRFSRRRMAKLFLFRSDIKGFQVTPSVRQTIPVPLLPLPEAESEGFGVRYEQLLGQHLSGYLRYTYREVTDPTGRFLCPGSPRPLPYHSVPMNPRSRALLGLSFVDGAGSKLLLETDWTDELFPNLPVRLVFPRSGTKLLVNLRVGKEARTMRREWRLRVTNLFNTGTLLWRGRRQPEELAECFLGPLGTIDFPAPGRTWELQYLLRF